ncbi:DNA polymerase III subunit [Psychromonas antarctica]|uniref:DNA polymerase III subunit n=1 Tax=Psychromonas antarctica TaxID=67573 RepID=UPI001EE89D40|nr:DNA polymerase III subunit [Psychromonas antarctica]MCG6199963.1 DNA polymerase III subunit [Psychromonas antarctica]
MNNQFSDVSTPWLTPIFEHLVATYQTGRFAHGLLLTGSTGIGIFKQAQKIAQYLLCSNKQADGPCYHCHSCNLFLAHNHLDFHFLENEVNKTIGIEQVRSLIAILNERPNLGDNKVVIIKNAQLLTVPAANALLKTLEEPQGNSYIILLARTHHQLMPTMLSRVQHTHLHTPEDSVLLAWLADLGFVVEDKGLLRLYQNSPLALLNHLKNVQQGSEQDERKNCVEGLFTLLYMPETLFTFSHFLAESVEKRLQLLFHLLHDLHKLKLSDDAIDNDAIYTFALPQLKIWQSQVTLKSLRYLCSELLHTRTLLIDHSGLKKELLINALLIKIKNEFKENTTC